MSVEHCELPERLQRLSQSTAQGCWVWTGSKTTRGYGMLKLERSRTKVMAHRYVWEVAVGPIPKGLVIDHLCRNPSCINPAHLEPVTQAENMRRGVNHTNDQRARTHCPRGHPLEGPNLYIQIRRGYAHRSCRICRRDAARRHATVTPAAPGLG